jgi:hypothetical protein
VNEQEGYEIPPVASRYRAGSGEHEPGPPQSFELASPAMLAERAASATAGETEELLPPGGPKFTGSIAGPVGAPGRRRRPGSPGAVTPGPMPGTFQPAWSLPAPKRPRRVRRNLARLLVLAILVAAAVFAYPQVRARLAARSVPSDLHAYVGGRRVTYAPAGQGYVVGLPSRPVTRDSQVPAAGDEPPLFVHRSIVGGRDFEIVIRVTDLTDTTALANGLTGALHDPQLAGGAPFNVHALLFEGQAALDYDLHASPAMRVRMFVRGRRLYNISVQSSAASAVLDAVAKSFRLSG